MELRHQRVEYKEITPSAEVAALFAWAQEHGATFPKLKYPAEFPPGYPGAVATAPVGPQESFVTVPMKLLLNAEKALESPIAPLFSEFPDVFQTHVSKDMFRLVAYIIHEIALGEQSFWAPFINTFPKDVEVLNDWTEAELEELEDYFLTTEVTGRRILLEMEWEVLKPALLAHPEWFPAEKVTFDTYFWLWKISLTRAFGRFKPSPSLIPVAEYVNHEFAYTHYIIGSPDANFRGFPLFDDYDHPQLDPGACQEPYSLLRLAELQLQLGGRTTNSEAGNEQLEMLQIWYNAMNAVAEGETKNHLGTNPTFTALEVEEKPEENTVFRLVSGENEYYDEGSQLFLFYGQYSNRQLLLNYGFTLPFNVYNFALVFLNLKQFANKFPRLCSLTEVMESPKFFVFKMRELQLCSAFIDLVRALYWNPNLQLATEFTSRFSFPHEVAVLVSCREILELYLRSFKTTLGEDKELAKQPGSLRTHFAISYRIGLKASLHNQVLFYNELIRTITRVHSGTKVAEIEEELERCNEWSRGTVTMKFALADYLAKLKSDGRE